MEQKEPTKSITTKGHINILITKCDKIVFNEKEYKIAESVDGKAFIHWNESSGWISKDHGGSEYGDFMDFSEVIALAEKKLRLE